MNINVDPKALEMNAELLNEHCTAYENTFHQIYQCIDVMQARWQGKDHLAYINQLRGFEKDFISLHHLMRNYAEFLRVSAIAYRSIQYDQATKART